MRTNEDHPFPFLDVNSAVFKNVTWSSANSKLPFPDRYRWERFCQLNFMNGMTTFQNIYNAEKIFSWSGTTSQTAISLSARTLILLKLSAFLTCTKDKVLFKKVIQEIDYSCSMRLRCSLSYLSLEKSIIDCHVNNSVQQTRIANFISPTQQLKFSFIKHESELFRCLC